MSTVVWRYRGREITVEDTVFIQQLIGENRAWSRRRLSAELCRAWNWVQANGALRDMVCRSLLLELHRAGWIELPAKRQSPPNNVVARNARVTSVSVRERRNRDPGRLRERWLCAPGDVRARGTRNGRWPSRRLSRCRSSERGWQPGWRRSSTGATAAGERALPWDGAPRP